MSLKGRIEKLEKAQGSSEELRVIIRWPEDPDYRPTAPRRWPGKPGEPFSFFWPDGSGVTPP